MSPPTIAGETAFITSGWMVELEDADLSVEIEFCAFKFHSVSMRGNWPSSYAE
jgi:hypothetical protein